MTPVEIIARLNLLVNVEDNDSPFSMELGGFAASEAAAYLVRNWSDALQQGGDLEHLAEDVTDVIDQLRMFKLAAEALAAEALAADPRATAQRQIDRIRHRMETVTSPLVLNDQRRAIARLEQQIRAMDRQEGTK